MMDAVRMWLLGVTVTSFLLSLAETLVTQEGVRRVLRLSGIIDRLEEMGIQEGDTVSILNFEFEYLR